VDALPFFKRNAGTFPLFGGGTSNLFEGSWGHPVTNVEPEGFRRRVLRLKRAQSSPPDRVLRLFVAVKTGFFSGRRNQSRSRRFLMRWVAN
jgi:hypothetical protein